jgi:phosphate butyryltransferase
MPAKPIKNFDDLLEAAGALPPKRIVVTLPENVETFEAIREALGRLPVHFLLVGKKEILGERLLSTGIPKGKAEIHDAATPSAALEGSIELLRADQGDLLMKGSIDTGTLMKAVLNERAGLRTGRLLSDVFVTESRSRHNPGLLMITDGGLTPAPDLHDKVALIENAVAVAHALGNLLPRVALLSATEFVSTALPSTLDAAILAKMNDRGQIRGCLVDGPLALDNALAMEAAAEKKIRSEVAGRADILVAPNIETANSLAKSTTYLAGWRLAHVIVGGKIPILIPSRADKSEAKLLSIALGMVMSEALRGEEATLRP